MNQSLRTIVLTGNDRRHRWVVHRLARDLNVVGVVGEAKAPSITSTTGLTSDDARVVGRHFAERDAAEATLLGDVPDFPRTDVRQVEAGVLNTEATYRWVRDRD